MLTLNIETMEKKLKFSFGNEKPTTCFYCGRAVSLDSAEAIELGSHFVMGPFHEDCTPLYAAHLLGNMDIPKGSPLAHFRKKFEDAYALCLFCGEPVLKERAKSIDDGYVHVTAKCLKYFHIR